MRTETREPAAPQKVTGWKGMSDDQHFDRLKSVLFRARGRRRFDRTAADRILDDLRHVAYRNGVAAAQVFQFMDEDFIEANEDLASVKDDLDRMSRNIPFIRKVTAAVQEIESIQDQMMEEARLFFGWRPYAERWAWPNPVWTELRQAFQEGRDDADKGVGKVVCPVFFTGTEEEIH